MSYAFRQTTIPAQSNSMVLKNNVEDIPVSDELADPFGDLGLVDLSVSELRETAYEILVGACRSSGSGKPLTYVSSHERSSSTLSLSSSLQRSIKSSAASKVKKALGLKSKKKGSDETGQTRDSASSGKPKRAMTAGELLRVQMKVSEQTDSRVRRALLRIAAARLGQRIESMVLPLELLHQFKSSDFPSQQDFEAWQKRNLKILEAGLLLYPHLPLDEADSAYRQLRKIVHETSERPMDTGKHSESMQVLRNIAMSLACRSFDGSVTEICHWADGVPFNLRLYQIILEACFDVDEETSIIEEVDEVLDLIKKTWVVLGINQLLHNLCFSWVLFQRYIATGQVENDLLFAAENLLLDVEKDAKIMKDTVYFRILSSVLSSLLGWAEKRLLAYHDNFYRGNIDVMQGILSLGMSAGKILVEDLPQEYRRRRKGCDTAYARVDTYVRSSLRNAFAQLREKIKLSRRSSKNQQNPLPFLSILAQDVIDLAFNEKEIYSPVLKRWHPLAIGVAVATLHTCYGDVLKQFVSGISELSPDAIQVLIGADKLEKDLVQMAVEDSEDSEDGGKAIIQEMTPYEAEGVIVRLAKSWIKTRLDRFKEWADRNLQQEVWNPGTNKERCAPSAVEVLRIMDETLDAFFLLPIPMHPALLPDLMSGLDRCLQSYILKAKSGCGSRSTFLPTMPALTRCTVGSKFGVLRKKDKSHLIERRKPLVGIMNGDSSYGIQQLCVRINTLHLIRRELGVLENRTITNLRNTGSTHVDDVINGVGKYFELSAAACVEGIQQLSEATAYKVVFHDLSHVLLDGLYVGEVSSSRIEPFLQELEQNLEILATTVHDRVRTRVINDVMKASFDGFLLVLLAGGPSRAFTLQDSAIIEEDLRFLMDLFWSSGDGLPADLIDKFSAKAKSVLALFHTDTESLVEQFKSATVENCANGAKSRIPLPPTSGHWSPNEANTILRVLCHRNDVVATKFLKKTYNLPKKL